MRLWQTIRASSMDWHRHQNAYAAVVLSGGYEEAGDFGRFRVEAGSMVVHGRFEAHVNRFSVSGAVLLNLRLPMNSGLASGVMLLTDPDSVARLAETNPREAVALLQLARMRVSHMPLDWPDELAAAMVRNPSLRFTEWGAERGLSPWTISRGFSQVFGIAPEVFRARTRARLAWNAARYSTLSLAKVAADLGFADQSHMTRSVRQLTGAGPQSWRCQCK